VGLSQSHLTHLFRRWAGLSPKAFLQALTIDHARALLRDSASVLEASLEVGLSGPGRLHDRAVWRREMPMASSWEAADAGGPNGWISTRLQP
jgi:AraC family transcriptional regulator of adaptative response/methylated-DNA-[protein]-cysteine methyltransferase